MGGTIISSPRIRGELGAEFIVTGLTREQAEGLVKCL